MRIPGNSVPVKIPQLGLSYASQSAAARALGVSASSVFRALEDGDLAGLYERAKSRGFASVRRGRPWPNAPKGINVNGVWFNSLCKAARALKMNTETFRRHYREAAANGENVVVEVKDQRHFDEAPR